MKRLLRNSIAFFVSLTLIQSASAQLHFETQHHFKPFEVLLDAGYARPAGKGAKAGVLLALEPRFNALDRLTVGLRMEATAMARGYAGISGMNPNANGEAGIGLSFVPTAEFYFANRTVRPFIGGGAGVYNFLSIEANSENGGSLAIPASTKFGGMARAGVEVWHFRAAVEYNFVRKTGDINNNYLGIKIGIILGGGQYSMEDLN
jgi:hypothetical protein